MSATTSLAYANTLVDTRVKKLDRVREANGRFIECPTAAEVYRRHVQMKGWYAPRDILINDFMGMAMLETPFARDKAGLEDAGYSLPSGQAVFSVDSFPFEALTLSTSMAATKYPYINVARGGKGQSDKQAREYEMFAQAVLDERMQDSNFVSDAMYRLMITGWLCTMYPYDPALAKRGEFPYFMQNLSPLGVYPNLDSRKKPTWVTIERRVMGSTLAQEYSFFAGVAEILKGEPEDLPEDSPASKEYGRDGNNFNTTLFNTVLYYDDAYTCLLIDGGEITSKAAEYNPTLKAMKDGAGKGRMWAAGAGSAIQKENPYAGVYEHKLGRIPIDFVWCWPEARDLTTADYRSSWAGRYVGLPFLFGEYQNWKDLCRLLSQMHTMAQAAAKPRLVVAAESYEQTGDILHIAPGEDAKYLVAPAITQDLIMLKQDLQSKVDAGTFGKAAYGARMGNSGGQQKSAMSAGSIRQNTVIAEIERGLAAAIRGITAIGMQRGSEELQAVGTGRKFEGNPYISEFDFASLKAMPSLLVRLKETNGLRDPDAVAEFKSLVEILPTEFLLEHILDEPNPGRIREQLRDEAVDKEKTNLAPYVQLGALKKQIKLAKQLAEKQLELEQVQQAEALASEKQKVEFSMRHLSEEKALKMAQDTVQKILGLQPGQDQGGDGNSDSQSGSGGNNSQMPPPQGGMPPGPGMGGPLPPPPQQPPPMMQGPPPRPPMPMPLQRPPMPGPMMPPPGMGPGPNIAKAPGQANQPIQPLSRMQPPGGVGRTNVPSQLRGAQGLPGQASPEIAAANARVAPIEALPTVGLGNQRNGKRRRGKRG